MSLWNDGESFNQWYDDAEPLLLSEPLELVWTRWLFTWWWRKWGRNRSLLSSFPDIWCNIYTPRRLREKSFPWSSKKKLAMAKISRSRCGSASSPTLRECVGRRSALTHSARNSPSPACSCIYSWPALVLLPSAHFIIHTYSTVATGNATISASAALLHFTGTGPSYARTRTNKPGGTGLNVSCIH